MNRNPARRVSTSMLIATFAFSASSVGALGARVPDPIPELIPAGDVTVGLQSVAGGLNNPVTATNAPGDKKHLFVVEQNGKIWSVPVNRGDDDRDSKDRDDHARRATRGPRLFADLGSFGLNLGCFGINYDERGTFGLAFHPDYRRNGLVYTFQSQSPAGSDTLPANQCNSTFPDHDNVVTEWHVKNPKSSRAMIDLDSRREVLRIAHPQFNHNGGEVRFGPDGLLYVSVGDGGAADDQGAGHTDPGGNAQDLSVLHGKILRIDPNSGSTAPGYSIPTDNPFVSTAGARGEIWAFGFRNPYKMSFDSGALYVADVGQNDIEEIDVVQAGGNYGWPIQEGSFIFNQNGSANGFVTGDTPSGDYIDPIAEYDHCRGPVDPALVGSCPQLEGVAVVGGFVYRGREIEALRGHYVFGDYSTNFFSGTGRLFYLDDDNRVKELVIDGRDQLGMGVLGIGQDGRGELYILGKSGAFPGNTGITDPANTTGVVLRLTAVDDD